MNIKEIQNIISAVKAGKNIEQRRREALEAAGYTVEPMGTKWNWGTSGTVREVDGEILAQLTCAEGKTSKRDNWRANLCYVHKITKA